ncbi:hypothetical protein AB0G05_19875 [Nonomuraea wenchangensis]
MSGIEIILGILLGLVVNEACDISPWLAGKLVKKAAHLKYRDPERAATRAEELAAVVAERPGKLFKLATAMAFAAGALVTRLAVLVQDLGNSLRLYARSAQMLWWARPGRRSPPIVISKGTLEIRIEEANVEQVVEIIRQLHEERPGGVPTT